MTSAIFSHKTLILGPLQDRVLIPENLYNRNGKPVIAEL